MRTIRSSAVPRPLSAPRERRLAELAERDIAAADQVSPGGAIVFSEEYKRIRTQLFRVNVIANVLILLTIYFMTAQTGA